MADYLKLLGTGAGAVGLKEDLDLILALVDLAKHWPEFRDKIEGFDTFEAFLSRFITHVGDPKIKEGFEKTGNEKLVTLHGKLVGLLNKLKAKLGEVPEEIQLLLNPLSTYNGPAAARDGAIAWTPIDETANFGEGGDFTFEIGGSASLALAAADKVKLGGVEKKLLKIGAALGVHAKGGGSVPFHPVKLGARFESSGGADLTFHFDPGPGDPLYGLAVATRLPALPDPFDYDAVWRAFANRKLGLQRLKYGLTGRTKANVELSMGNKLSFGDALVVDLALTVSADFSLEASYSLTLSAGTALGQGDADSAPREIAATLTRSSLTEEALTVGLKVDVDLSKLAKRIQTEVQKAVDKWDSLLKQVKPFLSPGTLIQKELSDALGEGVASLIRDEALRDAVTRDLRGLIGIDPDKNSDLAGWLEKQVTDAIDSVEGTLTEKTDAVVERVLDRLGDRLPAFAQDEIRTKLEPLIGGLLDRAKGKLDDLVTSLFDTKKKELGEALEKVGLKASQAVASLNDALQSVRTIVERFDKLIHDAVKELKDGARQKISVGLQAEERRRDEETVELAGTFTANSKAAGTVFHALTRGRLSDLRPLLVADVADDDFRLDAENSKLTLYSKRTSKLGWQVMFFGFGASGHDIASGEAKIVLDGRGTVEVDSTATIDKLFTGRNENRKVTFVEGFDLIRARLEGVAGDKKRVMDFGVNITHKDESLKLGEMRGFIKSLEDRGLLPAEAQASRRAETHFREWTNSGDEDAHIPADIAAALHLSAAQVAQLMMLDKRAGGRLDRATGVAIMDLALEKLLDASALPFGRTQDDKAKERRDKGKRLDAALKFIRETLFLGNYPAGASRGRILYDMQDPQGDPPGVLNRVWEDSPELIPHEGIPGRGEDIKYVLETLRTRLRLLVRLIDLMGEIYVAQPISLDAPSPLAWTQQIYADKQQDLANSGRDWIKTGGKLLFWIDREVQPWTVALLCVIAELARVGDAPAPTMSLTLTRRASQGVKALTIDLGKSD
jgi:hypothetical protein